MPGHTLCSISSHNCTGLRSSSLVRMCRKIQRGKCKMMMRERKTIRILAYPCIRTADCAAWFINLTIVVVPKNVIEAWFLASNILIICNFGHKNLSHDLTFWNFGCSEPEMDNVLRTLVRRVRKEETSYLLAYLLEKWSINLRENFTRYSRENVHGGPKIGTIICMP